MNEELRKEIESILSRAECGKVYKSFPPDVIISGGRCLNLKNELLALVGREKAMALTQIQDNLLEYFKSLWNRGKISMSTHCDYCGFINSLFPESPEE